MLISLLRPRHWIKNGFVVMPLIFAGDALMGAYVLQALIAVVYFCVAASAVYVLNDILDIEADKRHPVKCHKRPLASGACSMMQAKAVLLMLYAILLSSLNVMPNIAPYVMAYVVMNVAYSIKLKHIPVLDVFIIATGFLLRVLTGAEAIDVPLSHWMAMTMFSLALFLAVTKREKELKSIQDDARAALGGYSVVLIERYGMLSAVCTMMFYSFFIMLHRPELVMSIPLVLAGIFRYWYITEQKGLGESPTDALYQDPVMIGIVGVWVGVIVVALS